MLNAILYVAEHGGKWRGLPERFGNWHTVSPAAEPVVEERSSGSRVRASSTAAEDSGPDQGPSRRVPVREKNGAQCIGQSRDGGNSSLPLVAAEARTAVAFRLSPGHAHDVPEGRKLQTQRATPWNRPALFMDRAYEDEETRTSAARLSLQLVVPLIKRHRITPWE